MSGLYSRSSWDEHHARVTERAWLELYSIIIVLGQPLAGKKFLFLLGLPRFYNHFYPLILVWFGLVFGWGLTMYFRMASNTWCPCLSLPDAEITGEYHNTQIPWWEENVKLKKIITVSVSKPNHQNSSFFVKKKNPLKYCYLNIKFG